MFQRISIAALAALVTVLLTHGVAAQHDARPDSVHEQPGWTGVSHPEDVISTRRLLMDELQQLIRPIDAYAAGEPAEAEQLREAARSIAAIMAAVPHLYPPTTDRYDAGAEVPDTLALPAIWQDFDTFYRLATASVAAADALFATDSGATRQAAVTLRASCDACHALYLRPWEPAGVSSEDLEFDFDAIFAPD